MEKPAEILTEFINELTSEEIIFGETKLIKLFYLLEIEYYKQIRERLTDLKWIYYKYGPYAFEFEKILSKFPFIKDEYTFDLNKAFKSFKLDSYEKTQLDDFIKILIKKLIKRWGLEDTNDLLDYVYFETEPMEKAKKNEELDFSLIKEEERTAYKEVKLDSEIINGIFQKLKEKKKDIKKIQYNLKDQRSFKDFYYDLLSNKENVEIKGNCNFKE